MQPMTCSTCENLRRELEEQRTQITRYEARISDTVNAYKMLESQKQSLEIALSVMSVEVPTGDQQKGEAESSEKSMADQGDNGEEGDGKQQPNQLEALKQAITSLTLVNKRKEMEFKRDRRALVEAKEQLERRCEQLEQQIREQKQQGKSQTVRRLREQLAEMQTVQERAMTEHGMMLAEMQQQYGKEKRQSESLGKQVTEMSQRLAAKDDLLKRMEVQLREMAKMEQEMEALRRKAEMTPTVRVIRDELANVKASSEQEVSTLRTRYAMQSAQLRERDARVEQLEHRVQEVSGRSAQAEQQRIELTTRVAGMERELAEERTKSDERRRREATEEEIKSDLEEGRDLVEQFRALYQQLRAQQPEVDAAAALGLDTFPRPQSNCSDTAGLPVSSLASTPIPELATSRNASSINLTPLAEDANIHESATTALCDSCMTSRRELDYFKSLIGHLQRKLGALEENHARTKREQENAAEMLRERIVELESSQHRQYSQLTAEAKQRVADLEEELKSQRVRMLEIVAEKDREIELTKNSLAAFYARNYGAGDGGPFDEEGVQQQHLPMDPLPRTSCSSVTPPGSPAPIFRQSSTIKRGGRHGTGDSRRKASVSSVDRRRSSVEEQGIVDRPIGSALSHRAPVDFSASHNSASSRRPISRSSTLHLSHQFSGDGTMLAGAAARNIFYEQELCKREQEIGELRNMIRLLEMKVRDIEQAMLLKDVQYLQIIETLKEEIRVLEGRLTLASSQTNLAYLRNIFVQFLNQSSATGRKHILKAIGAVLQLTSTEMQRVDRWNH